MSRASRRILGPLLGVVIVIALAVAAGLTLQARHARDALMRADPEAILHDPALTRTALAIGRKGFATRCAACHGTGAADPARGIPDLTDGDHLYGSGQVSEIEQIVLHGIRSGDPRGWAIAAMPAYARAKPYAAEPIPPLTPGGVIDVTEYLLRRHGRETDAAAATRGERLFAGSGGCWDCHGTDGGGDDAVGAPNLLDDVWLYGDGSATSIARSIVNGRAGSSPAFGRTLPPGEARAIAVYVASLSQHPNQGSVP